MERTALAENRKERRYNVFMKAVVKEISQFPGCLIEVSKSGCRIDFPDIDFIDIEDFDFEGEYAATVYSGAESFDLTLKPSWIEPSDTGAVIGFSVLRTPGYRGFVRLVESLAEAEEEGGASHD